MSDHEVVVGDKKYCLAIPAYDGKVTLETMASFTDTIARMTMANVPWTFVTIKGNALIDSTRNELTHRFLNETDADYMICIDSDISWVWNDMARLLAWGVKYDFACGVYCARGDPPRFTINSTKLEPNEYGLVELEGVGFGFVIISRALLNQLDVPSYTKKGWDKPIKQFFKTGLRDGLYHGEDIEFCKLVKEQLGKSVMADPEIQLIHHGSKDYAYFFKDYLPLMMGKQDGYSGN